MNRSDFSEKDAPVDMPPASSPVSSDPRSQDDFGPHFYPTADGAPPPPPEAEARDDRIKREFCAVYYELNKLHARLTAMRSQADRPPGRVREREIMQAIEKHLRIRDALEDGYAPYGVIAEAITQEGFTIDIQFTFGDNTDLRWQRTQVVSSTALLFFEPEASGHREGA